MRGCCSFKEDEDYSQGKEDFERHGRPDYCRESYDTNDDAFFDGYKEAKEQYRRDEERRQEEHEQEEMEIRHQRELDEQRQQDEIYEEQLVEEQRRESEDCAKEQHANGD